MKSKLCGLVTAALALGTGTQGFANDFLPIIHGTPIAQSEESQHPYVKLFFVKKKAHALGACSGTLLSGGSRILTAAHCVANPSDIEQMGVARGTESQVPQVKPENIWVHPDFDPSNPAPHDLAVIRLDSPFGKPYGTLAREAITGDQQLTLYGYGITHLPEEGKPKDGLKDFGTLRSVVVRAVPRGAEMRVILDPISVPLSFRFEGYAPFFGNGYSESIDPKNRGGAASLGDSGGGAEARPDEIAGVISSVLPLTLGVNGKITILSFTELVDLAESTNQTFLKAHL